MSELIKSLGIPSLGLCVEQVTIVDWLVNERDRFRQGDEICEVETEKTTSAIEAPFDGT